MKWLIQLGLLVTLAGCNSSIMPPLGYSHSSFAKPTVALLPVINNTDTSIDWDVSDELTQGISRRITEKGSLYLAPQDSLQSAYQRFDGADLIGISNDSVKDFAASNQFIVLMELIEHKEVPYFRQQVKPIYPADGEVENVLMMKLRVKVVDLRGSVPQVILQEIVHSNHMIPKLPPSLDSSHITWGEDTYTTTSLGRAHARLERDIALQVERYISIAKNS